MKEFVDEQELSAAENEQDESNITIDLKKPVLYNGKEYTSLTFDFEKLTGADSLAIENELQAIGKVAIVPAISGEYLIRMAARACTEQMIGYDIFLGMALSDYNRIRSAARSFLLRSE